MTRRTKKFFYDKDNKNIFNDKGNNKMFLRQG